MNLLVSQCYATQQLLTELLFDASIQGIVCEMKIIILRREDKRKTTRSTHVAN